MPGVVGARVGENVLMNRDGIPDSLTEKFDHIVEARPDDDHAEAQTGIVGK